MTETPITQADRIAAAAIAVLPEMRDLILAGKADHHAAPFARHVAAERAEIALIIGERNRLIDRIELRDDEIAALKASLADIQEQAIVRLRDGDEMGARVWRIALVDILTEAESALAPEESK